MVHEEKKVAKIVEELTVYFFALGADTIESKIHREGNRIVISFLADYRQEYAHKLQHLDEYLNGPKNDGIEDVYWELAGSGDPGEASQLLLVGMMVDGAKIRMEEGYVIMELYKEQPE